MTLVSAYFDTAFLRLHLTNVMPVICIAWSHAWDF